MSLILSIIFVITNSLILFSVIVSALEIQSIFLVEFFHPFLQLRGNPCNFSEFNFLKTLFFNGKFL
ncbi:hypothetical protein DERP_010590 [Dermatophagoides pteronyssinus]|uniref:Uncharacterized protein n=1 Tax=Dermatophagoides pteronyssinus TaxID=6956 RepID=A0ABQ8JFT0_DERPT|nr:hypothetical protein DERP_010590 [Dermatophagoides pteronyssinus]